MEIVTYKEHKRLFSSFYFVCYFVYFIFAYEYKELEFFFNVYA